MSKVSPYIYFIRPKGMLGPIKIGFSASPAARLLQLSTWSPFPLELIASIPGSRSLENTLHECFADDWSHREWFFPSRRLVQAVERIAAGVPVEQAVDLSDKRGKRPRNISEQDWLCGTYNKRIAGAIRRAKRHFGNGWVIDEPHFIKQIMDPWRGSIAADRCARGPVPGPEEIAQVDAFLRNPINLVHRETRAQFLARTDVWTRTPSQPAPEPAPC